MSGVSALMFWSDSTHLVNFGTAKLLPIYLLFRNLARYSRKSNSGAEHHVAYILSAYQTLYKMSLPDFTLNGQLRKSTSRLIADDRQLMHTVSKLLPASWAMSF
ncbi:hypothetical protein R3P38DRAFT_1880996 [Favolaschia claudopus]|uniref:Uncharacterized protein n=1 Tax=Favolaschia claudopus TaxID=2862362 RepID=A0AAW0DFH0_9AGAR